MAVNQVDPSQNFKNPNAAQPNSVQDLQRLTEQFTRTEAIKQESVSKLMDKDAQQRGFAIVSNAVASFAKSSLGKIFEDHKKITSKDGKEISERDYLEDEALGQTGDTVSLSGRRKIARLEREMQLQRNQQDQTREIKVDSEKQQLLQEFTQLYGQIITSSSGALAEKLELLEKKLKDKGLSSNDLFELKLSIKTAMRGAVLDQIKSAFLRKQVSLDKVVEMGTAEIGLTSLLDTIIGNAGVGGTDFGGYKGDLQGTVNVAAEDVAREVRIALKEIIDQKMTERLVSASVKPEDVKKELQSLLEIGGRVGFNPQEYMKSWYQEKINQGLFVFNKPDMPSLMNNQMSQQNNQPNYDSDDEPSSETEDYLVNRLRALYIRQAVKDDWRTSLDTAFKMIKTKNKMIKLGIFSNDVNDKIKSESQMIAAVKIMEMLNEAFLERGTLYNMSGPAYKLVDAKITGLMKNAQKLGMDITEYDFNALRDKANFLVFDVSKRELKLTILGLAVKDSPPLREKKKKLIQLLKRLKEETAITEDLGLREDEIVDKVQVET